MVKSFLLSCVFIPPIMAVVVPILRNSSPMMALYLWGFLLVLALFMMTIYPVVIAPLFNKFKPLEEGA